MKKYRHLKRHLHFSERGDGTLTLMCALSLLLVAFFAVLNSMSKKDDRKLRLAIGSFVGGLGIMPAGINTEPGDKLLLASAPILDEKDNLENRGISSKGVDDLINYALHKNWRKNPIDVKKSPKGLTIILSGQAFFTPASADLDPRNIHLLDHISNLIKESSCDVLIKGYTDNIPISSDKYGSNWELSAARSRSVLWYFLKQGIPLSRLETFGYGEYNPLFINDTPEHQAINRRVEIQLVQKQEASVLLKDINIHGFLFKMRNLMKK